MEITLVGLISLFFGPICFYLGPKWCIFFFMLFSLLGASTAIISGGVVLAPGTIFGLLFIGSSFTSGNMSLKVADKLAFPYFGFWLAAILIYSLVSAYYFPKIMVGWTEVNPIGSTGYEPSSVPVPLTSSSGNLTQSIYLSISVLMVFCAYSYSYKAENILWMTRSILYFSVGNVLFAIFDIATFYTNSQFLLEPLRNTTYTLHVSETMAGLKRIVGSFTEASVFSSVTLSNLAFTWRLRNMPQFSRIARPLCLAQIILLLLSTSSTAYLGLAILMLFVVLGTLNKAGKGTLSVRDFQGIIGVAVLLFVFLLLCFQSADLQNIVINLFSDALLDKASSSSGIERHAWNVQAYQNFVDTFGFGVGLGGARASSFILAIMSNIGVFGVICYLCFICILLFGLRGAADEIGTIRKAAAAGSALMLMPSIISGTMVDQGLMFSVWAGLSFGCQDVLKRHKTSTEIPPALNTV